tara:strand:+ start:7 stop:633 length:627 start_codon:yes stop_codon:yes gene_type:complete
MALVKLNNRGVRSATTFGSISALGEMRFIKKQTASSSSTISFVDGTSDVVLDDTYKEYLFTFNNIHPGTNDSRILFQGSIDSGSNYNVAMTTTAFRAQHLEDDSVAQLAYQASADLAQGTGFQRLGILGLGSDNDECGGGYLHLFNPSSTTFVKHYISRFSETGAEPRQVDGFGAGYFNTTSAIDAIQFQFDNSSTIEAGDICLYGIN